MLGRMEMVEMDKKKTRLSTIKSNNSKVYTILLEVESISGGFSGFFFFGTAMSASSCVRAAAQALPG